MADIEIVYVSGLRCDLGCRYYDVEADCTECTECNEYYQLDVLGESKCADFHENDNGVCVHLEKEFSRRGWSGKRYLIHAPDIDITNWDECRMRVELGRSVYYNCVKVVFNGKCIFNRFDEESTE